jgi:hypothetical protein
MTLAAASADATPPWLSYVSLGFAALALVTSGITLWQSYLAPMRLSVACGMLNFRVTPFHSGESRWFMADARIDLTFGNSGARPGVIDSIRLRVGYPGLPVSGAYELFSLAFEADPKATALYQGDRLRWIDESAIGEGAPFVLLPKEHQVKRLIFSERWDSPVIAKGMAFVLQVYSRQWREWKDYGMWEFSLSEDMWVSMANKGEGYGFLASGSPREEVYRQPDNLHDYTRPKSMLPESSSRPNTVRQDYPHANSRFWRWVLRK